MQWYVEEETKELREALETMILGWSAVDKKKMFGCPCYLANGSMFAGLVTKGIILTKLTNTEKMELNKIKTANPFVAGERVIKGWVHIKLEANELTKVMPYVKKSYERAMLVKS